MKTINFFPRPGPATALPTALTRKQITSSHTFVLKPAAP